MMSTFLLLKNASNAVFLDDLSEVGAFPYNTSFVPVVQEKFMLIHKEKQIEIMRAAMRRAAVQLLGR